MAASVACGIGVASWVAYGHFSEPLLEIVHVSEVYSRRGDGLSANVSGKLFKRVKTLRYRVNDSEWQELERWHFRNVPPLFTAEMAASDLRPGKNHVTIVASAPLRQTETERLQFRYDPSPIELPLVVDWETAELDVQDGRWEKIQVDGEWRVRPTPGYEGYDRILGVTGAFAGGRRVETSVVYRSELGRTEYAFGVLSLWGGHSNDWSALPRRGWTFSLGWWWSKPGGAGSEMSHQRGSGKPSWVNSYRNMPIEANARYNTIIEVFPESDEAGRHSRYRQRLKWWRAGSKPPDEWVELTDTEGAALPLQEYSVALLAYNAQVEFGSVRISRVNGHLARHSGSP